MSFNGPGMMRSEIVQNENNSPFWIQFPYSFQETANTTLSRSLSETNDWISIQWIESKCICSHFGCVFRLFWLAKRPEPLCIGCGLRRRFIEKPDNVSISYFGKVFLKCLSHSSVSGNHADMVWHSSFQIFSI
jgi:hypothetical protein